MNIGLVADIEEELVFGRIEHKVQSQREFDHTQVGSQVATVFESV